MNLTKFESNRDTLRNKEIRKVLENRPDDSNPLAPHRASSSRYNRNDLSRLKKKKAMRKCAPFGEVIKWKEALSIACAGVNDGTHY